MGCLCIFDAYLRSAGVCLVYRKLKATQWLFMRVCVHDRDAFEQRPG